MLMSSLLPRMNSQAVKPLTRMPMPATTITVTAATGAGFDQAVDGFPDDAADGDEQEQRVEQRCEDRAGAQAIGEAL